MGRRSMRHLSVCVQYSSWLFCTHSFLVSCRRDRSHISNYNAWFRLFRMMSMDVTNNLSKFMFRSCFWHQWFLFAGLQLENVHIAFLLQSTVEMLDLDGKNNRSFYPFVLVFSIQPFIALNDDIYLFDATCWILVILRIYCVE